MDTGIDRSVVQFVFAVVRQEKLQALAHNRLTDGLSAECALNQNRSAVPHVAGDNVIRQLWSSNMA